MADWPDNPHPPTGDLPALESPEPSQHRDTANLDLSKLGLPPRERSRFEPPAPKQAAQSKQAVVQSKQDAVPPERTGDAPDPDEDDGAADAADDGTDGSADDTTDSSTGRRTDGSTDGSTDGTDGTDGDTGDGADGSIGGTALTFATATVYPPQFPPTDAPPEPPTKPQRTALGAVRVASRALVGTIGIGVAVVAIAAASWLPLPQHTLTPPSMLVTPTAATQQRVCPGPALQLASTLDASASAVSSIGQPSVAAASAAGAVRRSALGSTVGSATGPTVLTLPAVRAALAGSQSQTVSPAASGGGLAGFAAAECAEASDESWLIGGATDTGRTTLLTLSNPGAVPATVSVTVFTEKGEINAAGSDGIIVAGHSQSILPLAGFAPGALSPVVRVISQGGRVVANLQHSVVRTLAPGGFAIVGASAKPAKHALIPGVVVSATNTIAKRQNNDGFADLAPVLRLYVPGATAAKVDITIVPEDGSAAAEPVSIDVPAGVVTDVPLEVDDGSFAIGISAAVPVVAAARVSTIGASGGLDLSWFAAAPELDDSAEVAVASGPAPRLHLTNPTGMDTVATIASPGRADATVPVPAHAGVVVPVVPGAYTVTGFDTLAIAVSYLGDGQLGGFTVSPAAAAAAPIRVFP